MAKLTKNCPYCGEEIAEAAIKCRYCGEWLEEHTVSEPVALSSEVPTPPAMTPPPPQPGQSIVPPAMPEVEIEPEKKSFFGAYFIDTFFKHYADFSGMTGRKTFWLSLLAYYIIYLGVAGIYMALCGLIPMPGGLIAGAVVLGLFSLIMLIPGIALVIRRLRDAGKSPWWYLIVLVPFIGAILLIVFFCQPTYDIEKSEEAPEAKFKGVDWVVATGSVALLIVGIILFAAGMANQFSSGSFDSSDYDYDEKEYVDGDDYSVEGDVTEEVVAENSLSYVPDNGNFWNYPYYELSGIIDGKYRIHGSLYLDKGKGEYWYGNYNGNTLDIYVKSFDPKSGKIEIVEYNKKGEQTGFFDGRMDDNTTITGRFTNYQGKEMPFVIEQVMEP